MMNLILGADYYFYIDNNTLKGLRFLKPITFYNEATPFCGILSFDRLTDEPYSLNFFPEYIDRIIFKDMFDMAIYPRFYTSDDENIEELFDKSTPKVSKYEVYENDDGYYIETWHEIGINDLIVLHKDLIELENHIISNNPAPQKQMEIKPRKGVSIQKLQAKEQAKIIAKALWNNDKEQKIRIKEMAIAVYTELYDNGFKLQLPNSTDSLQNWIKDIAPPYATTGGRPKNEP